MKKTLRISTLITIDLVLLSMTSNISELVIQDSAHLEYKSSLLMLLLLLSNVACLTYRANPFFTYFLSDSC